MYYKVFDENLQGWNSFQFEVGKIFETDDDDTWHRFHMSRSIYPTIHHYNNPRICIVRSLAGVTDFGEGLVSASKIEIIRELTLEEILLKLKKEKVKKCTIKRIFIDPNIKK